ncbi:MAG TPA: lysylphosphatidylglycerol synthase domain-containing protein [Actinomycetospora sp.]|uniref:lysylphosphatidylglycerol synthase domain-containing protein n=1 Tax=Actinomycetospora sp. TaxID=1872135 RepID=UPI002F3F93C3
MVAVPLGVGLGAAVVAVVLAGGAAARSPTALASALGRLLPVAARVSWPRLRRRLGADPAATGRDWAAQLRPLVPGPAAGVLLFVTALGMYFLDAGALAAAARSVLPVLPWAALALGWVAGQVGMALQLTPGGLGLVETSLGGALLGAGLTVPQAAVVVAVYRGANWLLPALLGWAVYLLLAPGARRDLPRPHE